MASLTEVDQDLNFRNRYELSWSKPLQCLFVHYTCLKKQLNVDYMVLIDADAYDCPLNWMVL